MTITMITLIDTESVLYTVCTGDATLGDFGDAREVWRKEVPFGMGERFRAGGPAFVAATREQAQIAESYAMMPYEPKSADDDAEDEALKWASEGEETESKGRW